MNLLSDVITYLRRLIKAPTNADITDNLRLLCLPSGELGPHPALRSQNEVSVPDNPWHYAL